jgi:exodeoxyribonuclease-3
MKLISWNVNGIRAVLKRNFHEFVEEVNPDILCLQETKASPEQVELELPGYHEFWNAAEKKGYAGTAIFSKVEPLNVVNGIGDSEGDREGRVITLEFVDYFLVNVYTPNAQRGLTRLEYRQQWDGEFLNFLKELETKKPVIFCGDLNVAHKEIDLANPQSNRRNAGFTDEERAGFDNFMQSGFIDTFRKFVKEGGHYSWWTYISNARERNVGWRIDYFCISPALRPRLQDAFILPEIMGSDHGPGGIILE